MASQAFVLRVFIASPSDLDEERSRLEEVVAEWNVSWAENLNVRLELVKWESHSRPGIGADAQDVINRQIGDEYDIFIGLMWCRYGTPTGRSGSGTAEEFQRAKLRYDKEGDLGLMFYFKDAEIPPSKIDPEQLIKVNEFRAALGTEGVLYRTFRDVEEFVQLARMHLTKEVQEWKRKSGGKSERQESPAVEGAAVERLTDDDDEPGLLDYQDIFTTQAAALTEVMGRITAAQQRLTQSLNDRQAETESMIQNHSGDASALKRIAGQASLHMSQFSDRLDVEVPLFKKVLQEAVNSVTKVTTISLAMNGGKLPDGGLPLISLRDSMRGALEATRRMRQGAAGLPPLTKELRKARNRQVRSLDAFIDEMAFGERALTDVCTLVQPGLPTEGV
jgi:hypothetical protein